MEDFHKHIERMLEPYRAIQKITEPMRLMQQNLQKAMTPILELQKTFEHIRKIYASIPKFENPLLEQLEAFQKLGERLKSYAENTPRYLLLIAQNGWFIELDCELNFPSEVVTEIQNKNIDGANDLMINYYSENLDRIFEELKQRHSDRTEILNQILFSYRNENYLVMIPSVLTQVDGICFDFTKKKFFIKEKDNKYLPEISSELEKSAGNFLSIYLSPLQNKTPIMVQEKDIYKFPCRLNRNEILHGVSIDYGSKINSLKVISLLKYISDLLIELDKKH